MTGGELRGAGDSQQTESMKKRNLALEIEYGQEFTTTNRSDSQ